MSLLEQNIIKKRWVDKKIVDQLKFKASGNNEKYKVEGIYNNAVYNRKLEVSYLLGLNHLIS